MMSKLLFLCAFLVVASLGQLCAAPINTEPKSTRLEKTRFDAALLQQLIFKGINDERRRAGLRAFDPSQALTNASFEHSTDMASRDYFAHEKKRGLLGGKEGLRERLARNGANAPRVAENIAMLPAVKQKVTYYPPDAPWGTEMRGIRVTMNTYPELAAMAVSQWMQSEGHRTNILNPAFTAMGIGCALGTHNGSQYVYVTQDFGGN